MTTSQLMINLFEFVFEFLMKISNWTKDPPSSIKYMIGIVDFKLPNKRYGVPDATKNMKRMLMKGDPPKLTA